jgi:hypothetical protein
MKITIELTEAEVKGIKNYLKAVDDIKRPTKADITREIDSYVQAIHAPNCAISDYIKQAEAEIQSRHKPTTSPTQD